MNLLVVLVVVLVTSCQSDDFVKQGEGGEVCNGRDTDCRQGLVCTSGRCDDPGPGPTYDCGEICARLSACDAADPGCEPDCRISTTSWRLPAREKFGVCLVEELTCSEARATFAPQLCYSRIEIPPPRRATCDAFVDAARGCGASNDDAERVLEGCAAIARVRTENVWMEPLRCASVIETGICDEVATCFNQEFELDPAIEFVTF